MCVFTSFGLIPRGALNDKFVFIRNYQTFYSGSAVSHGAEVRVRHVLNLSVKHILTLFCAVSDQLISTVIA